jgi:hypothetical protein
MRKIFFLFSFLVLSLTIYAQGIVFSVEELPKYGLSMEHLDSLYKNGLPINDTIHPVFSQNYFDTVVDKSRLYLLQKIGDYFMANKLNWEPSVSCWNRLYLNTDGTIDFFIYHFMQPVDSIKEIEFKRLLNLFFKENKVTVKATQKYSICGQVIWKDKVN